MIWVAAIFIVLFIIVYSTSKSGEKNDENQADKKKEPEKEIGLFDVLFTNKPIPKDKVHKSHYSESELDNYGLSEEEKKLVRSGKYEPWEFEENGEMDEDDYYNDDGDEYKDD